MNAFIGPSDRFALGVAEADARSRAFNPHFRQLPKVAADMGAACLQALDTGRERIGGLVAETLFDKHLRPLFLAGRDTLPGS